MHFIFAKLYEEYLKKGEIAKTRIAAYISIFYFLLTFVIILPTSVYLEKKNSFALSKLENIIIVFGYFSLIITLVNFLYVKNDYIQKLTNRYKKKKINKIALYFIAVVIIPILVILAGIVTVLINGGIIWTTEFNGWIK